MGEVLISVKAEYWVGGGSLYYSVYFCVGLKFSITKHVFDCMKEDAISILQIK